MSEIEDAIRKQMLAERQSHQSTNGNSTGQPRRGAKHSKLEGAKSQGGIMGALAALALLLMKFGAPLLALLSKLKFLAVFKVFLVTGGSMIVSMWAWSTMFGWSFAVGVVILIFIHECGHAIAGKALGHKIGAMVFIPFMGAFVAVGRGKNIVEDAHVGIMGPVFGTIGGLGCLVIFQFTRNPFWLALAQFNFFINLFNLLPMPPLDGSWITPLFSPKLLLLGVVLLFVILPSNPLIWILCLMSLPRIIGGWRVKPDDAYYKAPTSARWKYGIAYLGLAAFLGYSYLVLHEELSERFRPRQQVAMQVDSNIKRS